MAEKVTGKMELLVMETDKEDLKAIIELRFGVVPDIVRQRIESLDRRQTLERLIIVAANATTLETLMEELFLETDSFRIVGEQFNPAL